MPLFPRRTPEHFHEHAYTTPIHPATTPHARRSHARAPRTSPRGFPPSHSLPSIDCRDLLVRRAGSSSLYSTMMHVCDGCWLYQPPPSNYFPPSFGRFWTLRSSPDAEQRQLSIYVLCSDRKTLCLYCDVISVAVAVSCVDSEHARGVNPFSLCHQHLFAGAQNYHFCFEKSRPETCKPTENPKL